MSLTKQMEAFVRVAIRKVEGETVFWQAALRPMADPESHHGGKKKALILRFGDVERAVSDYRGAPEVSTFEFEVDDKDGFWRGILSDFNTQYVVSSDVAFYLCSQAGRIAGALPRSGFFGQLEKPRLLTGRKFSIGVQGRIGTRYGPVNHSGPVLKRTHNSISQGGDFNDETFPRESEGKPVRFLWGEKTDAGMENEYGEDIATGRMSLVNCGKVFLGDTPGTPPTAPTYLPDPPAPTVVPVGAGGSTTWTFAVHVRTANGHTRLGATTTVDDLPSNGNWTGGEVDDDAMPTNGATVHLAPYSAALMDQVTGATLWVKKGAADSPYKWNKVDAAGQMFNSTANEYFTGPAGYMANGDDRFDKGGTPPASNTAQITPGTAGTDSRSIFYNFWSFTGHMSKITGIYGSDLAESPAYIALPAEIIGDEWTSGKDILLGANGDGYELTLNGRYYRGIMAKGAINEAAETGSFPFRVNGCGWPEENDNANPIIDQAAIAYLDVFTQLGGNDGKGYESGARLPIPVFTSFPSIPAIQSTTFEAVQDVTKAFLSDDKGYIATIELNDLSLTWGQFIADMNFERHWDTSENHHGQLKLTIMNDTLSPTAGDEYRQYQHILQVQEPGTVQDERIVNIWNWEYFHDEFASKWRSGVLEMRDPISIHMYGERRLASPIQIKYSEDKRTISDGISRRMMDESTGPIIIGVTLKQKRATQIETGDQILLSHRDLMVETPVPIYVRRYRHSYHGRNIVIEGRDRRGTYAHVIADDTIPDYDTATPEQLQTYFYISNDDGFLPNGMPGSRIA
mgnify:CR=1 FL=1